MKHKFTPNTPKVHREEQDPYRRHAKEAGALVCTHCGLVRHAGKWYRGAPPLGEETAGVCPACERIRDRYPAGTVRLQGLPNQFHDEVVGLIRNVAEHEQAEHPLERLMDVEEHGQEFVVTTTGMHLARCVAGALRRRFHDGVVVQYPPETDVVCVQWPR